MDQCGCGWSDPGPSDEARLPGWASPDVWPAGDPGGQEPRRATQPPPPPGSRLGSPRSGSSTGLHVGGLGDCPGPLAHLKANQTNPVSLGSPHVLIRRRAFSLRLNHLPLCACDTLSLPIHLSKDTGGAQSSRDTRTAKWHLP